MVELLEPVAPTAAPVPPVTLTPLPVVALPVSVLLLVVLPVLGMLPEELEEESDEPVPVAGGAAGVLDVLGVLLGVVVVLLSVLGLQAASESVPATINARAAPRVREHAFIGNLLLVVVCCEL